MRSATQVALAAGFDAQHAEAVFFVVEGDALDEAGQYLRRARRRYAPHPGIMEIELRAATAIERSP
jgi:hypothetical protein